MIAEALDGQIDVAPFQRGEAVSTLTPEFGPAPYLHALPYTQVPVADLADICDWQARRQQARFVKSGDSSVSQAK